MTPDGALRRIPVAEAEYGASAAGHAPGPWTHELAVADLKSGRLAYTDAGEGPVLLLLHGLGNCSRFWAPVAPSLAAGGVRVIAVDLPGFGNSPLPRRILTPAHVSRALAELVRHLDVSELTVVGHSMGAAIAVHYAAADSSCVDRLVLVSGALEAVVRSLRRPWRSAASDPALLANLAAQIIGAGLPVPRPAREALLRNAGLRRALLASFVAHPNRLDDATLAFVLRNLGHPAVYAAAAAAAFFDYPANLERLSCPVSLINGDRDALSRTADVVALAQQIPHATAILLEGVGHWPMLEAPGPFCRALLHEIAAEPSPTRPAPRPERAPATR